MVPKKSAINMGKQWYAQSAHCAHTGHTFTFGPKGAGDCTEMVVNGLKKSTKNRGSQCYHQSAHSAHTGDENGKCGFCGRF